MDTINKIAGWINRHILEIVFGQFLSTLAYFADMKYIFHILFITFVADFVIGLVHSIKIDKVPFSTEKFYWHFIARMAIVFFLIMILYAGDKEMKIGTYNMANYISYFIFGMLLISIAKNGNVLTGNKLLLLKVVDLIEKKIQDIFGIDISDKNEC